MTFRCAESALKILIGHIIDYVTNIKTAETVDLFWDFFSTFVLRFVMANNLGLNNCLSSNYTMVIGDRQGELR